MKIEIGDSNFISIFIRKLKPGKTYDDFRKAWLPDKDFDFPVRVINAVNENDPGEILSVGLMKLPESLNDTIVSIAGQEAVRHNRIDGIISETKLKGIYKIMNDDDLSKL